MNEQQFDQLLTTLSELTESHEKLAKAIEGINKHGLTIYANSGLFGISLSGDLVLDSGKYFGIHVRNDSDSEPIPIEIKKYY
jgi:hypothetical protein